MEYQLPLFKNIVFVDWHGVLSKDFFWNSILSNRNHPLWSNLSHKLGHFLNEQSIGENWMRGEITYDQVISNLEIKTDRRFGDDYLSRRLHKDCEKMLVNGGLVEELRKFQPFIKIVLATDNMDCFIDSFDCAKKKRFTSDTNTLSHWAHVCDDAICSSDIGILKAENPTEFFGPLLKRYNLEFPNALLIDDRADNCDAFRTAGGSALRWKMGVNQVDEIVDYLHSWLFKSNDQISVNEISKIDHTSDESQQIELEF